MDNFIRIRNWVINLNQVKAVLMDDRQVTVYFATQENSESSDKLEKITFINQDAEKVRNFFNRVARDPDQG
jgi:hypothetical protein